MSEIQKIFKVDHAFNYNLSFHNFQLHSITSAQMAADLQKCLVNRAVKQLEMTGQNISNHMGAITVVKMKKKKKNH